MSEQSCEFFFDAWATYQKVVAGNYMFHREIGAELDVAIRTHFAGRPFSFLDLGCGDAAALAPLLKALPPERYKGVDVSDNALTLAAENLKILACPVELVHEDIMATLAEDGRDDVIHSSFALHHLPTVQKAEFFRRAAQRLTQGGLLLLIDVVREEDESLEVYHRHYCAWLRSSFHDLNEDEKDAICGHIVKNDRPEARSLLQAQAEAAGLKVAQPGTHYGWHWLLCFTPA